MAMDWGRRVALVSAVLVSGCAGVPQLYKPKLPLSDQTKDIAPAPKVDQIIDQISCELREISRTQLKDKRYIIKVNLTLQVDDEINLTPSLSFIEPLTVASTSRTMTQGLSLGGSRQRKFVADFSYDTELLQGDGEGRGKNRELFPAACGAAKDKLYRLDGHLGLFEIARDGVAIDKNRVGATGTSSFSSQVRFVVTRSVGALGPTWTLVSFKGPGGANGLLNGKALNTDSVDIAFVPYKAPAPDPAMERLIAEIESLVRMLERNERDERAAAQQESSARRARTTTQERISRKNSKLLSTADQTALDFADGAVDAAVTRRKMLSEARIDAERRLADARMKVIAAADETRSREDAIREGEALINRMILQNLNVPPR